MYWLSAISQLFSSRFFCNSTSMDCSISSSLAFFCFRWSSVALEANVNLAITEPWKIIHHNFYNIFDHSYTKYTSYISSLLKIAESFFILFCNIIVFQKIQLTIIIFIEFRKIVETKFAFQIVNTRFSRTTNVGKLFGQLIRRKFLVVFQLFQTIANVAVVTERKKCFSTKCTMFCKIIFEL